MSQRHHSAEPVDPMKSECNSSRASSARSSDLKNEFNLNSRCLKSQLKQANVNIVINADVAGALDRDNRLDRGAT